MTVLFRTTGTLRGPAFFLKRGGGGLGAVRMPVTVAVIERPDGLVLVDTGWSRRACAWPDVDPGRAAKLFLGLDVKPEDALASQLLSLGYAPGDVRHIVATHLHLDHVSGAVDFPSATVHCAEAEWEALRAGRRGYDARALELPRVERHTPRGAPRSASPRRTTSSATARCCSTPADGRLARGGGEAPGGVGAARGDAAMFATSAWTTRPPRASTCAR
jgi:glyoxylase-like metal-dependent hydrolase (beta-lactamase superfamily II)